MNIGLLRNLLDKYSVKYGRDERSIKLLRRLFEARGFEDTSIYDALDFLRRIVDLRNKLPPYHRPSLNEARDNERTRYRIPC
jgi:hypothetical protein